MNTFAAIVEEIQNLSTDEIEEVHGLTEKYLIERRRDEILKNAREAERDYRNGRLDVFENIEAIKAKLKNL